MAIDRTEGIRLLAHLHTGAAHARMVTIDNLTSIGLKGLQLVNGGALIALFTLIAQGASTSYVKRLDPGFAIGAAAAFILGLILSLVATLIGFFAQQLALMNDTNIVQSMVVAELDRQPMPDVSDVVRRGNRLIVIAAIVAAGSLAAFITGSCVALAGALQSAGVI